MSSPPVRGDNLRAYVQVDKHGITISYYLHHEIFRAKVGKGGIKTVTLMFRDKNIGSRMS